MITATLVMYLCASDAKDDCQVWLAGRWVGDDAVAECEYKRAQGQAELTFKAPDAVVLLTCQVEED
jgi:hypothetical protein